MTKQDSD